MADTVVLNARVEPETRDELNKIIDQIMKENQFKRAGDAYAQLVEIVKQQQSEVHPDFKEYIATIKANSNAIVSSAMAMNDTFLAYQNNQEQINKEAQLGLSKQINLLQMDKEKLNDRIEDLTKEMEQKEKELNDIKQENTNLNKQIETLQKELQKQDQIEELLNSVNQLINKESNEESEVLKNQMTIEDYIKKDSN